MPIDWSKYGTEDKKTSGIDWNKYETPSVIQGSTVQSKPADNRSFAEKAQTSPVANVLDFIFKENSISRVLNFIPATMAQASIPDAPLIRDGKSIPGTSARQSFAEETPILSTGSKTADKILGGAGELGSYVLNPAQPAAGPIQLYNAARNLGASKIGQVAEKATNLLPNKGLALNKSGTKIVESLPSRALREAGKEATVAAAYAPMHSLIQGQTSPQEIATNTALETAAGIAAGSLFPLVGAGVKRILSKYIKEPVKAVEPVLALPEGRATQRLRAAEQRSTLAPNTDPIANPYTFPLPEASPQSLGKIENISQGRKDLADINNEIKLLNDRYQGAIQDQYKLLKQQLAERGGVEKRGPLINERGEVVGSKKGFSMNPEWYQQFYAERGKVPSNKELLEIAKEHVDNGYTDFGLEIPSWKAENQFDDSINALSEVKGTLENSIRELDPALTLVDTPLKENVLTFPKKAPKLSLEEVTGEVKAAKPILEEATGVNPTEVLDDLIQTKEPRMRDKVVSFLDEQEQAARERLKAKRTTLSSLPLDQYTDYAIIGAAKLGKGAVKFADWSEAMIKDFGEEIRPHLQKIYNRSVAQLKDAERRATKQAQEARAFNASNEGDATTFRSKVSRDKKANRIPFSKRWEAIRTQAIDDMAPLEGVEKRIRGKLSSAEDSLYKSARLFKGVPEKANRIVKDRLAPIINDIEKKGYTSVDLGDYALAVHARDVNARDIKSGFTNREINEVIERLGTAEMEAARKEIIKISDDMLAELEKNGVISEELVSALKDRYPNYMPLFRNFDDEKVEFAAGLSKALANVTSPIKGLKGSEREVIDPFESMVKNIFQSTNAAERNKVALQLAKLAEEDTDNLFMRQLADGEEVGRKNVVGVLQGGEKVRYEVEPEVYKAMLNLDQESSNMLIKVLQKPASVLRAGATLTPEFSLRNPLRDVVQAFVTSNSGFNPLIDFPVGLIQSVSKGDLYKQWIKELGGYGNIVSNDRQVHKEALERVLKESPGKKFVNIVNGKSLIKVLRAISDTTESATKVGEFRAALRKGVSLQEAAYRSRDIMDFGRAGNSIRQTNKIVAFLNANIQGKSKIIRAFKENPAGFTARAFTAVTAPSIGVFIMQNTMANDAQKQTITEAPQWMKDTFWLLPVLGTNQVARIPKPFDLATLFSNLPERALEFVFHNDKKAFNDFAKRTMEDLALPGMISGLIPIIEGMANYSFFQQRSIIPRGEEGRNFEDQFDINTTESAKVLAKGMQKLTGGQGTLKNFSSPRIMDNTIRGLTAGLGSYATSAVDVMLDKFNYTDKPVKPQKGLAQRPLTKAFLVNPLQGGKSTEKLYDLKDELTREKGSAKLNQKPFKEQGKLTFITNATDNMSDLTKRVRKIENSRTLTAVEKRKQIEPLISRRNQIARDAIKRLESP